MCGRAKVRIVRFERLPKGESVRISQDALQEIIARSAMGLPGVLQVKSSLRERENGLQIMVSCQFEQGVIIPQTSENFKRRLKQMSNFIPEL